MPLRRSWNSSPPKVAKRCEPKGLAAWNTYWGRAESGSKEVPEVRFGWQESHYQQPEVAIASMRQATEALRRQYGAEKLKDDFGPNWDLIGPGAAYVRALAAAGKAGAQGGPAA